MKYIILFSFLTLLGACQQNKDSRFYDAFIQGGKVSEIHYPNEEDSFFQIIVRAFVEGEEHEQTDLSIKTNGHGIDSAMMYEPFSMQPIYVDSILMQKLIAHFLSVKSVKDAFAEHEKAHPCKDTIQMSWPVNKYEVGDTILGERGYFANDSCDYKMIYFRKHEHLDSTWAIFVKL